MSDKELLAKYGFGAKPKRPQQSYFELNRDLPRPVREARVRQAQQFSQSAKGVDLERLDPYSFDVIEETALREAEQGCQTSGKLFAFQTQDEGGRPVTAYSGDPRAWMGQFMDEGKRIKFNRHAGTHKEGDTWVKNGEHLESVPNKRSPGL